MLHGEGEWKLWMELKLLISCPRNGEIILDYLEESSVTRESLKAEEEDVATEDNAERYNICFEGGGRGPKQSNVGMGLQAL